MRSGLARLVVSLLVTLSLGAPAPGGADVSGSVEQVTLTSDEHGPVLVVRTSRPLRYHTQLIASPPRLVIDFEDARFAWRGGPIRPGSGPILEVRGSQFRAGTARVVVALGGPVPHRIAGTPEGLRVTFGPPEPSPAAAPRAAAPPRTEALTPRTEASAAGPPVLYGIVFRGDDSVAYMADPRTRRVSGYRRGEAVGGGVLETIEERHVTLRLPSGTVDIRVDDPKPGGPPAPRIQIGPGATRP